MASRQITRNLPQISVIVSRELEQDLRRRAIENELSVADVIRQLIKAGIRADDSRESK
jgi:hypothetical protein